MTAPGAMGDAVVGDVRPLQPDPLEQGEWPGPLVDAGWLVEHHGAPGVVLVHVDGDSSGYYSAHLPHAQSH